MYSKTIWNNGATPPLNATNLNHGETQYDEVKAEIAKIDGTSDVQVHGSNLVNGSVTAAKVAADIVTQAELDAHLAESASETAKGHVELATAAETTTGTDNTRAVHPAGLKVELDKKLNLTGGSMTGILNAQNGFNYTRSANYKASTDLPSTYPQGETLFFNNNAAGWPATYGTVHTIKTFTNMACIQYYYPYNVDAPVKYRYGLYNSDTWTAWRTVWDSNFDGSGSGMDADLVDGLHFQVSGGVLQYDSGGGWTNVAGVKSVQRGSTSVSSGATVNVTITSVDLNKSHIVWPNNDSPLAGTNISQARLTLSTNLELKNATNNAATYNWEVVESY